jgi:hypothetical protein
VQIALIHVPSMCKYVVGVHTEGNKGSPFFAQTQTGYTPNILDSRPKTKAYQKHLTWSEVAPSKGVVRYHLGESPIPGVE